MLSPFRDINLIFVNLNKTNSCNNKNPSDSMEKSKIMLSSLKGVKNPKKNTQTNNNDKITLMRYLFLNKDLMINTVINM